jgi:HlyD family secretion protein
MVGGIAATGGAPMFTIVRGGDLELMADVAETDILKLKAGQTARLTFVGLNQPVEGKVRLVEPRVDTVTRLGRVRISIQHPEQVRSGMFADAEIVAQEKSALVLPVSATGGGAEPVALRVDDGTVHAVRIETGIREGGLIEVLSGLKAGDTVVTKAGAFVRDGDRINPVPADLSAAASN